MINKDLQRIERNIQRADLAMIIIFGVLIFGIVYILIQII